MAASCDLLPTSIIDIRVGPGPSDLKPSTAFRLFPIAHQYDLRLIQEWCTEAVGAAQPIPLWPSSEPVTSASVPHQPGLVQWLALADQKHCEELVGSCVTQLTSLNGDVMRQALVSRHMGPLVDGLSSDTKSDIIWRLVGLPLSIKVGIIKGRLTLQISRPVQMYAWPFHSFEILLIAAGSHTSFTLYLYSPGQQDPRCGESAAHNVLRISEC